jgi:hypothetical protein
VNYFFFFFFFFFFAAREWEKGLYGEMLGMNGGQENLVKGVLVCYLFLFIKLVEL